ncbi:di-heme oxidoredictase family protein [Noviherbaspirillum saxi]|uniref:Thiol oxidoreductase n=1 Tax=Noviherbaspirillum saxi TaxID=2320863 RepID=A0A3A3GGS2_9BURK|nr:di-heme oxidoredictase family protein [Noviherbaspirillum saxi]RJG00100.1 thiol oxidoreductase [Noviherbaspirillum saxi]
MHKLFSRSRLSIALVGALALCSAGVASQFDWSRPEPGEEKSAGDTTVFETNRRAFSLPAANMSMERRGQFAVGHSFFNMPWVEAPSSTRARDGLGPHFIGRSCTACHTHDGRAAPPEDGEQAMGLLLRLSIPGKDKYGGPLPEPTYGGQFNNQANDGVKPEGTVEITYAEIAGSFADGTPYSLRKPTYRLTSLGYGPLHPTTQISPRIAPQMIGLGLLEAIPEKDILARADAEDRNHDGISGRANRVWDGFANATRLGRFGWKANTPTVAHQTAGAANGDMGITSRQFPNEECMAAQKDCKTAARGGKPEINERNMASLIFYTATTAVPARRDVDNPQVLRGKQLFHQAQCVGCHTPKHVTGNVKGFPELSRQTIRPYTDMLLHDMGEGLADNRPDFLADGREWRTPPLWGIGLIETVNGHTTYLHDGRARNLSEAILWHGGEATPAKLTFEKMSKAERTALLAFLNSL